LSAPAALPRLHLLAALLAALLALAGCASKNERDMKSGADVLYDRAHSAMDSGNYRNAITYYETLSARFPFSNQAKQAQLDLIYCYYRNGEPESAIDAASQFERENPTHPRVDYALYMRGLANFTGESNVFYRFFNVDPARRPLGKANESFSAFAQLLQRYPQSIYAADARQRMVFLRNDIANSELTVARYYFRRGAYVGAANRAKYIVENYQQAAQIPDALALMVQSYEALGQKDLADDARRVLEANAPDHPYLTGASVEGKRSWWSRLWPF